MTAAHIGLQELDRLQGQQCEKAGGVWFPITSGTLHDIAEALTDVFAVTVIWQGPVPVHAPSQPVNWLPAVAAANSSMVVARNSVSPQLAT